MQNNECRKIKLSKNGGLVALHKSILFDSLDFKHFELLEKEVLDAIKLTSEQVNLTFLDIDIVPNQHWLIMPEFGFGAITYSANSLYVSVDIEKITKDSITKEFGSLIAHELNHVARLTKLPIDNWDGLTFIDDAIQEGIATLFQEILYPESSLYINKTVLEDIDSWIEKAKNLYHKDRTSYNRNEWFFGSDDIPRWVGYTIGYYLVKQYYEKSKVSLEELTTLSSKEFI